ncbi:Ig-like domain-containing protein [Pseudocolwellia sp. HL-MZ19]|uniref:Ig-like domain-containing protein n=1 Tax=Pseudocolwellia sp. HL-MZ19 TaxID=3400846 RepID=UPI003CECAA76
MHKHVLGILVCMLLPICTSSLAKSPEEQAIAAADKNKTNKVLTKEQNSLVNELVIIDAAVPNKHLFFQHLKAGTDVVEINSSQSGFKQLESTLNKYKNLSALHLISHADDGVLYFGDSQITQQALSEKITLLSTMNHALTANADVLFYGCNLAKTEKGNALLDFISQQANVDVAASNNPTGSALQGGDWQLEVHKGDINTSPLFTASTMQSFDSVLLVDATLDLTALPLVSAPVIDVSIGGTDHVLKIEPSGGVSDIQAVLGHVLLASALTTHTSVDIYLESGETFDLTNLTILNLDLGFGVSHKVKVTSNKGGIVESDTLLYSLLGVPLDFSGTDWEEITRITIEYSDGVPLSLLALSHISIANVVSLPSISNLNGDAFTYTEGSGVQKLDQGVAALLTDPGLLTGAYTGGTLTAEITSGIISAEDTLTIDTGVVSLANNLVGGALTVSGVIIGELVNDILPGNILSFTLNDFATPALLQILLQGLAYENVETDDPTEGVRVVSVTLTDADGETSNVSAISITVASQNDAPTLTNLNTDILSYVLGSGSQYLDQGDLTLVVDVDSLNFLNGYLSVSITNNKDSSEDILSLGAGVDVDVSALVSVAGLTVGGEVSVGAVVVGTLANEIIEGSDLLIDLNANATILNIQVLIRALVYLNKDIVDASLLSRTITITLNDGDGGTSTAQLLTVNLAAPTYDNDGTLTDAAVVIEPVDLPLSADSIGEAVDLFDFTITDGGSSDSTPMMVSQVVVNVAGTISETDLAKITWRLNSNTLNTDVENVAGVYNSSNNTVTFLTPALSIADGTNEILTVNAYFNDPTGLTHDNTLQLSIDGDTDLTLAVGSTMDGNSTPVTNGSGSLITDDVGPTVTSVSVPADDTYAIGDLLSFTVNFDEAVNVDITAGTPRLAITIGENTRYIDYVSGDGSTALVFTYTLVAGDIDNDGLVLNTTLDLNLGTLLDAAGNTVDTTLNNIPTLIGVLSDGSAPVLAEVTAVISPALYTTPAFTFSSNEAGTLDVGGACGSLNEGSILSGNSTITLTQIDNLTAFASGTYSGCTVTVTDAAGNATELTLTAFTIDATAPTVSVADITLDEGSTDTVISDTYLTSSDNNASAADITYTLVAAPSNGTLSNAGVELNSDDTFTQADIANSDITYSHDGNESTSDTFTFTVSDAVGNVNDNNGSNLTFTVTVTPQNDAPSVLHLNDDTLNYVQGETAQLLDHPAFALISDADSADFDGGSLNVSITAGKQASEDLLGFDINVILDGSAAGSSVTINSILVGTLTEELVTGSNLVIGFNTDATLANVQDLVRAITYVNTAGAVTTGTRTLSLILEDGDGGTSTSQTLNVSVTSAPIDSDGTLTSAPDVSEPVNLPLSANTDANAVDLFDFTITDGGTNDGTPMVVSHVAVNVAGSISDTDIAKITWRLNSNDPNANVSNVIGVYNTNDSTVTFDTPTLSIADGSSEILTVNAYYNDPTGLTHGDTLLLNIDGYTNLTLAAGSEMSSTSSPVNNGLGSIITDDIGPIVTSVSAPTNGTYAIGDDLTFTVNFDEAIVVNTAGGTPRLTITIGATTRYVDYVSGSGSNALTFTYRLVAGDIDSDGLVLSTSLDVNSGTLADALGNAINTSLNNIPTLTGVLADGDAPVLTEVTTVVSPTMNATPAFTFSSSEAGNLTVGGACGSSDVGSISSGNTTISLTSTDGFTPLTSGDYSDCTVTVTDAAGNATELTLTAFTIDTLAPSVDVFAPNTVNEGASDIIITSTNLSSADNNDSAADITYTLLGVPSNGSLSKNAVNLLVNDTFTQADIDNEAITYSHNGAELSVDSFTFTVSDSAGNVNNNGSVNFTFALVITQGNDAPVVLNLNADILNYVQGSSAQNLDQNDLATVDDNDSLDFDGGTLTLSVLTNKQETEDLLGVDDTVELSYFDAGGSVTVNGQVIGFLVEDLVTGNDLVIELNSSATPLNVQALVRALTYANTNPITATTTDRTIRLTLEDGDGGTSTPQDIQVSMTALPSDIDATVTDAAFVAEPVAFPSSANASNRTVDLLDFTITDGGTADGYPTAVSTVVINVAGTISETDLAKITWYLDSNLPNIDVNYKLGIYNSIDNTITFATPALSIADSTSEILTIKAFYHDATGLTHDDTLILSLDGDTDLTLSAGTKMAVTTPVTNGSGAVITDNTNPMVTSVSAPSNDTYGLGETLSFIVNFDEGIIINTSNGTPRLAITIGETVRYAEYVSGSGTTALVFNYTVVADDEDIDGLVLNESIDANGGSLTDTAGNTIDINLNNIDDLTAILFDADAPLLTEITPVVVLGTDTTPEVSFSTSKAGTFAVEGACGSSDTGVINTGEHTVTLTKTDNVTPLASGEYSDCTVTVTDAIGNKSELLLTTFAIDITAPSVDVLLPNTLDEGAIAVVIPTSNLSSSDNADSAANITYTLVTTPDNGELSKADTVLKTNNTFSQADIDNGAITYTHDGGESTSDTFAFSLSDSLGNVNDNGAENFDFTLVITPQNDAPNSTNDIASTTEDSTVIIDVLANDSDADGTLNKTSVFIVTSPTNGSVSVNTITGTIAYTPALDVSGTDTFVYTVEDDQGQVSETASVTVTIYAQNDAPVVLADTASTPMNTLVSIDVAANDIDKDTGDSLNPTTIAIVKEASNGTAILNSATNKVDYTPNATFYGVDTFTYTIKDNAGATSKPATVSITVTFVEGPPNVAPAAVDDSANVQEDSSIVINVLANDSDSDGTLNTNSVSIVTMPSDGIISVNMTTGAVTYTPSANFNGSDTFSYNVKDNSNDTSNTATVAITVTAVADVPVISGVPANVINEDESYSFTPNVSSDDGTATFTFSIENKPSWAVFNTSSGSLTGIPTNADVGTFSNIQIIVSDGESQASLPDFSLTVSNVNDAPFAVNDSYLLIQNVTGSYSLNVLENDYDEDVNDSFSIVSATAKVGSVSINENGLTYQNGTTQTPDTIKYTIEDASGSQATAEVSIAISPEESDTTPDLTLPEDIEANATGLFTWLEIGIAQAFDSSGNSLAVQILNDTTLFPPGDNQVYWRAEDSEGNFVLKTQNVKINPLVNLGPDKSILEGKTVTTKVYLNGDAPSYPLTVPYTVSGSASSSDHSLVSGEVVFTSGHQASISFTIFDDVIVEDNETIIISLGDTINRGSKSIQTLSITEANLAPEVELLVTQSSEKRFIITKSEAEALINASISDANSQDTHTTTWASTIVNTSTESTLFSFNPALLDVGMYTVEITVTDNGVPSLGVTNTVYIEIANELVVLGEEDSDGDSIPDNLEGHADDDNDGIPNYLDGIGDCQTLHTKVNDTNSYLMEGEAGACLRIGGSVANIGSKASLITTGEADSNLGADTEAMNTSGVFDFIAYNLPKAGQSYRVVIPQRLPIPTGAVYRKYNQTEKWHNFISDDKNKVYSTLGLIGYCPAPGSDLWTEGLTSGNWCVQLLIEDGGPNDDDGLANGSIIDPSGVASPSTSNNLPVAVDDAASVRINLSVTIDALSNDTDADDHELTLMNVAVDFGTVSIENNQVLYVADSAFIGTTNISYTLSDSEGGTATATIVLTVEANQTPTANDDSYATSDVQAITLDVLTNDTDPEGDTLTITAASAFLGSVTFTGTEIVYTPAIGTEGIETVDYEISDDSGATATGTAYIVVTINEAPIANSDNITVNGPESVIIQVLENDTDNDNDTIKVTAASALSGNVTFVDAHIVYTPPIALVDSDTISYEISDAFGNTAESTVNVTIVLKRDTEFKIKNSSGGGSLGYLTILFFMSMMFMRRQLKVNKSR